jgi:hypothetical protein
MKREKKEKRKGTGGKWCSAAQGLQSYSENVSQAVQSERTRYIPTLLSSWNVTQEPFEAAHTDHTQHTHRAHTTQSSLLLTS